MRTGFKTALQRNRSVVIFGVQLSIWIMFSLTWARVVDSAVFNCSSGDMACLIAAINEANGMPGEHIINLAPGTYKGNEEIELPSITGSIRIQASADDHLPTVIEEGFPIFHVTVGGKLSLDGVTVQKGLVAIINFGVTSLQDSVVTDNGSFEREAIINFGVASLQDSVVTHNHGDGGTINNLGTLNLYRTIVAHNIQVHEAGGILNEAGGNVLIESSTIANNGADGSGGIRNRGSMIVKNSSIIFNDGSDSGGIGNNTGDLQIVNSTIARNTAGDFGGGGGVRNFNGFVSITNSTIRENQAIFASGGGIENFSGTVMLQNTIVAGNTINGEGIGFDCVGMVTSLGNNLIGDPTDCAINLQPSDLTGDPGLGPLAGTEEDVPPGRAFYAVPTGSAVIDKANPAACPETDQLGNPRVGVCDIGAIEFPSPPAPDIVNNLVSFVPVTATFKTTSNAVDCPPSFVGKFSFDARLTNTTKGVTLSNLILAVTTLTNNNALKRADGVLVREPDFNSPPDSV